MLFYIAFERNDQAIPPKNAKMAARAKRPASSAEALCGWGRHSAGFGSIEQAKLAAGNLLCNAYSQRTLEPVDAYESLTATATPGLVAPSMFTPFANGVAQACRRGS
jgi:hypothetical protein